MTLHLLATIGTITYVDGSMIDGRVWFDDDDPGHLVYFGECTRGNSEILSHVGPYETREEAVIHAVAAALAPDARRKRAE